MKESKVQQLIHQHYIKKSDVKAVIPNIYFFNNSFECDVLAITDDCKTIEFEIKASKWDYLQDFKKKDKHDRMENVPNDLSAIPNRFYFVCPENMIDMNEVRLMGYSGLIYIIDKGAGKTYLKEVWEAPELHNERITFDKYKELVYKLSSRLW